MSFPTFTTKKYSAKAPVSGKDFEYRPYTIAEEEPLLEAKQSEKETQISSAIKNIVSACTFNSIDSANDSYIDVIYAFTIIRARSVEEKSTVSVTCECGQHVPVTLDVVDSLKLVHPEREDVVTIPNGDENVTFHLRPITFDAFTKAGQQDSLIDSDLTLFRAAIKSMEQGEESYDIQGATDKEWETFFTSLPKNVYAQIEDYLQNQPKAYIVIDTECSCGKKIYREVEGTENFT